MAAAAAAKRPPAPPSAGLKKCMSADMASSMNKFDPKKKGPRRRLSTIIRDKKVENSGNETKRVLRKKDKEVFVFSENNMTKERDLTKLTSPKTEAQRTFLNDALGNHFLFQRLKGRAREQFIGCMQIEELKPGHVCIVEGEMKEDNEMFFYTVETGIFNVTIKGERVAVINQGGNFGELALLHSCPRAATVESASAATVWKVDGSTFRYLLASSAEDYREECKAMLRKVPLFSRLSPSQLASCAEAGASVVHTAGSTFKIDQGVFHVIKTGTAQKPSYTAGDGLMLDLGSGDCFGEQAFSHVSGDDALFRALAGDSATPTVPEGGIVATAITDIETLSFHVTKLLELVDRSALLGGLRRMSAMTAERTRRKSETIAEEVRAAAEAMVAEQEAELVIAGGDGSDGSDDDIAITEPGDDDDAAPTAPDSSDGSASNRRQSVTDLFKSRKPVSMDLEEYEIMRLLGVGSFGAVKLVQNKDTQQTYALKQLQKHQIVITKQQSNTLNEKRALLECAHPFTLRLLGTTQDVDCLYMLLELVQGGELFRLLHGDGTEDKPMSTVQSRFYASCVVMAFEYLHENEWVYRDLKPENLLLDTQGYVKVVDFGFAKKMTKDKTYTVCGTWIHSSYSIHHAPCTMRPHYIHHAPYTMQYTLYTIHHTPCTIHHAPCTMHSLYILCR
jgi:CRP-like cAMP-binding protein